MSSNPLLLLDNNTMMTVVNHGTFKCTDVTFEEAKAIIELHPQEDILKCFSNLDIEEIIFDYLDFQNAGMILAKGAGTVGMMPRKYLEEAYSLGRNL